MEFSVAISVYKNDNPEYFDRALCSITDEQTLKPNEIVLVVDGPVPTEIEEVIEKYQNKYPIFKIIRFEENQGLGNALRSAVENASYSLIARMDSDDISLPTRFEKQIEFFQNNPDTDIVGGDITEFIEEEANIVAKRSVPCEDIEIKEYMKTRCPLNHVTVVYKRDGVLNCGNYLDLFWNEDYYLWIRMAESGCIMANTGEVAVNVRTGQDMYKRRGGMKYFKSEYFLQKYMLERKMIGKTTFMVNVLKRFIIQVLCPPSVRGFIYRKFARKKA